MTRSSSGFWLAALLAVIAVIGVLRFSRPSYQPDSLSPGLDPQVASIRRSLTSLTAGDSSAGPASLALGLMLKGELDSARLLLEQEAATAPVRERAALLILLGRSCLETGELDRALAVLLRSTLLASRERDSATLAHGYAALGDLYAAKDSADPALWNYAVALRLRRSLHDTFGARLITRAIERLGRPVPTDTSSGSDAGSRDRSRPQPADSVPSETVRTSGHPEVESLLPALHPDTLKPDSGTPPESLRPRGR